MLKITRESVVKAVRLGLKPADIVARLTRHASNELPANVLQEVKEWSSWVRRVTFSKVTVLRCGDAEIPPIASWPCSGAEAERLSDTMVAIDQAKLTASERDKLLGQGIIVQTDSDARSDDRNRRPISS